MNVSYRVNNNTLYISLDGRIDASNAATAEKMIFDIKNENPGLHTVVDADTLEYISSAGLRIILKLRKEDSELVIINVSPDVYEIFNMTGFTDMVKVEKAYRRISIEGCEFIAKGANGAVYRYDDETIVKTYFSKDALPEIQQERENARRAFVLGVNTAIPYDIVRVGDGFGSVTELLNATSITRLIKSNVDNLEYPARLYVKLLKDIHAIELEPGDMPDMKAIALDWADFVSNHIPEDSAAKLKSVISAVPDCNILLHGDYNTNNILVQNEEPLIIDLDTLCMGHPIFELGSMFNAFVGFSAVTGDETNSFFGYDLDTSYNFWNISLKMYLDTDDEDVVNSVAEKSMIIGYTRILRRAVRRPNDPNSASIVEYCKNKLVKLLEKIDTLEF